MSESIDFIKKFEELIKEKPMLEAKLVDINNQIENGLKELEKIENKKKSILTEISVSRETSKNEISEYNDKVNKILEKERIRLDDEAVVQSKIIEKNIKKFQELRQYNNELADREQKVIEREKKTEHLKIELKVQREVNTKLKENIEAERQKIEKIKKDNIEYLASIKSSLNDNEVIRQDNSVTKKKIKEQLRHIEEWKAELEERVKKFKIEIEKLSKIKTTIGTKQEEINMQLKILAKNKKNLDDKEKSLNAMQMDIDFKIAKLKTKGISL